MGVAIYLRRVAFRFADDFSAKCQMLGASSFWCCYNRADSEYHLPTDNLIVSARYEVLSVQFCIAIVSEIQRRFLGSSRSAEPVLTLMLAMPRNPWSFFLSFL